MSEAVVVTRSGPMTEFFGSHSTADTILRCCWGGRDGVVRREAGRGRAMHVGRGMKVEEVADATVWLGMTTS